MSYMNVHRVYQSLFEAYGPQHWWPKHAGRKRIGFDPVFEILAGAILTQNTAWKNVEHAIARLYQEQRLDVMRMCQIRPEKLRQLITPAGYFNQKARKLKILARYIRDRYKSDARMFASKIARDDLLEVWGIGPETADSILLYAGNRPEFVIDTYTKRLCKTHGVVLPTYDAYKAFFQTRLEPNPTLFNEYHALIVRWGKEN